MSTAIKQLVYQSLCDKITRTLNGDGFAPPSLDGHKLAADKTAVPQVTLHRDVNDLDPTESEPTAQELATTLKVLRSISRDNPSSLESCDRVTRLIESRLFEADAISDRSSSPTKDASNEHIPEHDNSEYDTSNPNNEQTPSWGEHVDVYRPQRPSRVQRLCYICHFRLTRPHPRYRSMCEFCGAFNLAGAALSLPKSLHLDDRTALVTGARVNLGYHTALRLLRCGARVIASTRYPHDAAVRYASESDFGSWKDRLKVVGADFRTAVDAFALVRATKQALREWRTDALDVLVNNAAQTLTDSIKKEERALQREQLLLHEAPETGLLMDHTSYQPKIRGGTTPLALYGAPDRKAIGLDLADDQVLARDGVKDDGRTEMDQYFKSSWVQSISEIPYEDVVSAHAVNTFVPLILCRELLPMMGRTRTGQQLRADHPLPTGPPQPSQNQPDQPSAYIINVSSREGIFEVSPRHPAKRGHHVHTNMSKAGLNMITETQAAEAWRTRRVAMNTVDPGYMSAAPEMENLFEGGMPLGWEDGAGRVLWPVAIGEVEKQAVWGRFLKHYGAVKVEPGLERR